MTETPSHQENEPEPFLNVATVSNAMDSLETAVAMLARHDDFKWKWIAVAVHHALYAFGVAALEYGNPAWVITVGPGNPDDNRYCRRGDNPKWRKSRRVLLGSGPAYRIIWEDVDGEPPVTLGKKSDGPKRREKLVDFWTVLARIQDDEFWMRRQIITRAARIDDTALSRIAWLTMEVRNQLIHYIPKFLLISIPDIRDACLDCLRVIEALVFESHALVCIERGWEKRVETAIGALRRGLCSESTGPHHAG